jgi:cytochrome c-type protein NapB
VNVAAIAIAALTVAGTAPGRTPEAKIGLSKGSAMDVQAPPRVKENESAPGDRRVRARAYPGAAPAVPHAVGDFLPITKDQNACVDCHAVAEKKKGEPTPIPASHYTDLRNAPGVRADKVVGARWSCTACHVPQEDVAPLVKGPFPR